MLFNNFFTMGGYAIYVWSAYSVTFVVLLLNIILAVRNERKVLGKLKKKLQDKKGPK